MANEDDKTGMLLKDLSPAEVKARANELAKEELERDKLLEKKRSHNREWNEELRQAHQRISKLAKEVDSKQAWVMAQEDLFEDDDEDDRPSRRGANDNAEASVA